jgi:hypothetical protein
VTTTRSVIVEAFTDQGLVGIGETDPESMFIGERGVACHLINP